MYSSEEPVWPTTWSQLTNLTKLHFRCTDSRNNTYLPQFLTDLRNVRNLELATDIRHFDNSWEEYLVLIAMRLTLLTKLEIIVALPRKSELRWGMMERFEETCKNANHRMPGMLYIPPDVDKRRYHMVKEGPLIYMLEKIEGV